MFHKFYLKLSDREKKIFNFTVIVVLIVMTERLFLTPALSKLKSIDEEINHQEISVQNDLAILDYKDRIIQKSEAFSKFVQIQVKDDDVINADFLSTVEQLATKEEVNLIKSTPTEMLKQKHTVEYYANLDCVGRLKNIISFMHAINSTEDLLKITHFSLTPKRGTEDEVNASMTIVKLLMIPVSTDDISSE